MDEIGLIEVARHGCRGLQQCAHRQPPTLQDSTEKLRATEERAAEAEAGVARLEAHVADLESRKRAPLYQKKQVGPHARVERNSALLHTLGAPGAGCGRNSCMCAEGVRQQPLVLVEA